MKTYEKPKLMVLSISADAAICACTVKTRFNNDLSDTLEEYFPGSNHDGLFEKWEAEKSFAPTETCDVPFDYMGYCKFTTAESGYTLFTS